MMQEMVNPVSRRALETLQDFYQRERPAAAIAPRGKQQVHRIG
jgi:hypothetical protein